MGKYRVLVTARSFGSVDSKAKELLEAHNCEIKKLEAADGPITEQLAQEIGTADAIIAGLENYDRSLLEKAGQLKVLSRYGVGYDKVDVQAAEEKNIIVTITPGANGDSVADMAVALMLNCARNITIMDNSIKGKNGVRPSGVEMWEKTLGVIGTGRIGKGVARRCKGFNMQILCYDKYQDDLFSKEFGAKYVDLDTLIQESDFITIHSPLTEETKNMFGAREFQMMKKDAILINTARGGIVDEMALYTALKNGEIRGAGLDATVQEPPYDSPLCALQNCIITPHAGAATKEASSKMSLMAAQNVIEVLETGNCSYKI